MDIQSSQNVTFRVERRNTDGRPRSFHMVEQIAEGKYGDDTFSLCQTINRQGFEVRRDGESVFFSVRDLISAAAHILIVGHPSERPAADPINLAGSGPVPIELRED
jgi:hypothetical protein